MATAKVLHADLYRLEMIADEIEHVTEGGTAELDLEGVAPEDVKELLLAMVEGVENLAMCLRGTICGLGIKQARPAPARRSA